MKRRKWPIYKAVRFYNFERLNRNSEGVFQNCYDVRYKNFRLDDDEIPNSATALDDSSDENSFVEKIVDDIVFVVAEDLVDELELQSYSHRLQQKGTL